MNPTDLMYTKEHEWLKLEGTVATMGITDHAQSALGDIVFVEQPEEGTDVAVGDECLQLESAKAAASIYASVAGVVCGANEALEDAPELVNSDPYGEGWMVKIEIEAKPEGLMTAAEYEVYLEACE